MHRPTTLAFLAAVAGAAALAAISVTGAGPAAAAPLTFHSAIPARYTTGKAGYVTGGGGWRFRYVETSLKIPACQADPGRNAGAAISLSAGTRYLASIAVVCGGGADSVGYFDRHVRTGAFHVSPGVGDVVTIKIYRKAGHDYFTATDATTGRTQTVAVATPPVVAYRHAALLASLASTDVTVPVSDLRLWAFTNSKVTSDSGEHGTVFGPWPTHQLVGTADGTATGTVVLSASYPSGNGRYFSVWLRH